MPAFNCSTSIFNGAAEIALCSTFCSTFGCFLDIPRYRMKNARYVRFAYEKGESRLIRSDQMKSMISEF